MLTFIYLFILSLIAMLAANTVVKWICEISLRIKQKIELQNDKTT